MTIVVFTQEHGLLGMAGEECDLCRETRELAEEFAAVSDQVRVEVHDFLAADDTAADDTAAADYGIERIPALVLLGPDRRDVGIRFYGIPAGYELATIISDLLRLSAGTPDLSAATRAALAGLGRDVHLKVFVTSTCVRTAHGWCTWPTSWPWPASGSGPTRSRPSEFPELVQRYGVMGVPKVVINERVEVQGAVPEQVLVGMVLGAVASPAEEVAQCAAATP